MAVDGDKLIQDDLSGYELAFESQGLDIHYFAKGIKDLADRAEYKPKATGLDMLAKSRGFYSAEKKELTGKLTVEVIKYAEPEDK